ncbi:hypothetical protein pdam_00003857 [Pocillopora damicornis]|uniref:TRAF-type domain-containing protein n=1 Tax=Pocillopora damicornis TaxID=46731 RepID=A0A3M6T4K5_POCDA|nr:hypothetical protein pdam_00003857 [Pocillopora damicornis]
MWTSILLGLSGTSFRFHALYFLQTHEDSCQYGFVKCQACGETVERRQLTAHREQDCTNRAVACTYCGGEVRHSYMKVR